jgi:hypothetical protein
MLKAHHRTWPEWAVTYLRVFRLVVVGTCLSLLVVAYVLHVPWLVMASACIALGEFLECTYYLVVLRWGVRSGFISGGA